VEAARDLPGVPTDSSVGRWALAESFADLFDPTLQGDALVQAVEAWHRSYLGPPPGPGAWTLPTSMALLPTAAPAALSERFLATVAAMLITTGRVQVADAAAAQQVDASAVSTAVAQLAERLAAVGSRRSMTVSPSLAVLAHAAEAAGRIRALKALSSLTTEAVMTLVIVGHLEEATRRDVDERRGADSTNVLAAAPRARSTVETPARRRRTTPAPSRGLRSRRRGTKGRG